MHSLFTINYLLCCLHLQPGIWNIYPLPARKKMDTVRNGEKRWETLILTMTNLIQALSFRNYKFTCKRKVLQQCISKLYIRNTCYGVSVTQLVIIIPWLNIWSSLVVLSGKTNSNESWKHLSIWLKWTQFTRMLTVEFERRTNE